MFSPSISIKAMPFLLLVLGLFSLPAVAADIETLVMPGKVIEGHADKENECTSCHVRFGKTTQNSLCLKCHEDVAGDVQHKTGFHGRAPQVSAAQCSSCHSDHKGREADIVLLERELFNHKLTDFKLTGKHLRVECNTCHKPETKWRKAPTECISCHREQDVHKEKLGKQCADCHSTDNWAKPDFNHDNTDFPLSGAHRKVLCAACHPNQRTHDTPKECVNCHRIDDIHRGGFGKECANCHSSENWSTIKFDHNKTDFKLHGAHQQTACSSCHRPGEESKKLATNCISCHRNDDLHKGRNGERCQDCHNSQSWRKSNFNHNKDTGFKLSGPHAKATCNACHAEGIKKDAPVRNCAACHLSEDVHQGKLGDDCASCHVADDWVSKVRFDHDMTAFPLYGMHALATCESCHTKGNYASLPIGCIDCHRDADEHKGALGEACDSCHNGNSWQLWQFDHGSTDFTLTGAHDGLACNSCHHKAPANETLSDCAACHLSDDIHNGRFGRNCSRCHDTEDFNRIRIQP